jgi:hypothetical protein
MDPIISQPEPQPIPHRHFLNKKFALTFVILALVGVGAYAGIWWWGNQNSKVAVPSATPDPTAGWQTYTNTQFGYSFKYPADWKLTEYTDGVDVEPPSSDGHNTYFGVSIDSRTWSQVQTEFNKPGVADQFVVQDIVVDGIPAKEYGVKSGNQTAGSIFLTFSNTTYHISLFRPAINPTAVKTVNDILSTLKFNNSATISTWKTYHNEQYGFEFKYPADWKLTLNLLPNSFQEFLVQNTSNKQAVRVSVSSGYPDILGDYKYGQPSNKSVGGVSAQEIISKDICDAGECSGSVVELWTKKNNYFFSFIFYGTQDISSVYDQILSTFKFTK